MGPLISPNINKEDGLAIIKSLMEMPPEEALRRFCTEPDQQKHFAQVRALYQAIGNSMKAFFAGEASPFMGMSKSDEEWLQRQRDRWIYLYWMLHDSWGDVTNFQALQGYFLIVQRPFPSLPRDMMALLLEYDALISLWECFDFATPEQGSFSPSTQRKLAKKYREAVAKRDQGKLSPDELAKYNKQFKRYAAPVLLSVPKDMCIAAIEESAKRNSLTAKRLREYRLNETEIEREAARYTHPQNYKCSYQWVNGVKRSRSP